MTYRNMVNISIDPGITGTGIAIWKRRTWKEKDLPILALDISVPHKQYEKRLAEYVNKIHNVVKNYIVDKVYIEEPSYWDSHRGNVSARSQSLIKLVRYCGYIEHFFVNMYGVNSIIWVPVRDWKGQLSKQITINRIREMYPHQELKYPPHSWDAIGVGLFKKGYFK